jgi:hemerythrin-like domain-containing protein
MDGELAMSFLDRIIGAITPPETDEHRMQVRAETRAETTPGDWLSLILDHHDQIEEAFAAVKAAPDATSRKSAQKQLALILTGHANAEEAVLYPEMADSGHKAHASMAYEEQAMTKVQLALLDKIEPMTQDYLDKLEHIRGAVTHHMFQEESSWFLDLKSEVPAARQTLMTQRYIDEMERYAGDVMA